MNENTYEQNQESTTEVTQEAIHVCSECGAKLIASEAHEFEGHIYCEDCLDDLTVLCDCCSTRIRRDDAEGNDSLILCTRCYEDRYTTCEDCGCLIPNDNAYYDDDSDYPYCASCFQKLKERPIHSYNYKPEPIFYGSENDLYMGVELEIDKGGELDENAEKLLDVANFSRDHIYCKHDGSIHDGFEIVSHPMTLEYHTSKMNWKEVFEKALEMRYASHNTSTCGFHVHCSRYAFGEDSYTQDAAIGRVVFFVEKHWNELVRFSRRHADALERWAARYATISPTTKETFKKAKDKRMGRYVAVNLENYETIEFRLFRGTLRYETFIATLQLVSEICNTAIALTDKEMENLSWSDFVLRIDKENRSELINYLKLKQLYVNEPVCEITDESEGV